jgi:hypothetical protein
MTHSEAKGIIDQCQQKYAMSCSSSAIEMVLKLHGRVTMDFSEFQDKHQSQNVGFEPFADKTLFGITFHEHTDSEPFLKLRSDIARETYEGRFVVVSTREPQGEFHIWIATEVCLTDVKALSKRNGATVEILLFQDRLNRWPHGHYLTYTMVTEGNFAEPAGSDNGRKRSNQS